MQAVAADVAKVLQYKKQIKLKRKPSISRGFFIENQ
jgi:hypothetical protein